VWAAVDAGVDGQRPLVIDLKRAGVHVLVVAEIDLVDLHLGDHASVVPSGSRDHPAKGRAEVAGPWELADRLRL
jgi:hypothetical protein